RGVRATVIERAGVACAASGKSGGFLALDWCDSTPLEALARRSFALHSQLAEEIGGDWCYRRMTTYAGFAAARAGRRSGGGHHLNWVSDGVTLPQRLGGTQTTAQVHPGQFTQALMQAAQPHAELRIGTVTGVARDGTNITDVDVDGETVAGDAVVIAMG